MSHYPIPEDYETEPQKTMGAIFHELASNGNEYSTYNPYDPRYYGGKASQMGIGYAFDTEDGLNSLHFEYNEDGLESVVIAGVNTPELGDLWDGVFIDNLTNNSPAIAGSSSAQWESNTQLGKEAQSYLNTIAAGLVNGHPIPLGLYKPTDIENPNLIEDHYIVVTLPLQNKGEIEVDGSQINPRLSYYPNKTFQLKSEFRNSQVIFEVEIGFGRWFRYIEPSQTGRFYKLKSIKPLQNSKA